MTPAPPRLRPHQIEAADAALAAFASGERRATVVSACGTGKTLTAAHIADQTAGEGHVLVVVPTLELLAQTIQRWRQAGRGGTVIGVSSMKQTTSGLSTEQAIMTTDADAVAQLIERARGPVTVFVTYGSLPRIRYIHDQYRIPAWDLAVIDEAHRATRRSDKGWGVIHDDAQIPAKLRLYMTATPRIFRTPAPANGLSSLFESMPDATMDRVDIFGPTVYRLGLADAIERGILADYRVVMPVIEDTDLRTILTAPPAGTSHHNGLRTAALHVAVLRAIADHDLRRVLVFHNRIAAAHAFAKALPGTMRQVTGDLRIPDLWSHAVDSTQKTWQRRRLLQDFDATSRRAVLSNVRVLNEGVDIIWGRPGCGARRVRAPIWGGGVFQEAQHRRSGWRLRSARVSSVPRVPVDLCRWWGAVGGGRCRHLRPAPASHGLPGLAAVAGVFAEHRACLRGPCGSLPELLPGPGRRLGCSAFSGARGPAAVADLRASRPAFSCGGRRSSRSSARPGRRTR